MPEICCVLNCPHVSGQCQFRNFPKDAEKCVLWKRHIRQNTMVIKKQTRICDCHFESSMFWQNKEGKRYLKANAVPSIIAPKAKNTPMQKITKVSPDKNMNKEVQYVQGAMREQQGKRKYPGYCEDYDPGTKRQRTGNQFETEVVPSAQKEAARVPKRSQVESEGTTAPKQVVRLPKRNQVESQNPSPAHKQGSKVPKHSQVESEGTPPAQKEVAKARKGSQTENDRPSVHSEVARVTKRSQIESEGTPSAQKVVARAPKRSQIKNASAPYAQNEVVKAPKNVQHEVPPLEKPKVAKPPNKEVSQEAVTDTKTTPNKKWCKLDEICRLCIKKCHRPTNVHDSDLAFKIQAIASIREMCLTDGLPANVCQDCKDMTNIFFSFKLQCEAADEALRSCLKVLQAEESNDTVVKQQTVAKPLFPELFKFSAFSSDDESDNEEVDSEVLEEEEEATIPAASAEHTVQAVPAVKATPAVQAVPAVKATPMVKTVPAAKSVPMVQTVPVVKAAPAVRKIAMIHKVPATPSTSTMRTREHSPPSSSLQDELDKAWTEFSYEKGSVVMRKSTPTARKENKPQYTESKNVMPKKKPLTKSVASPKPAILLSPALQKELGQRKDEPQKESTPQSVYKSHLLERQNKSLHTKADLMKYLGNNVEVIQQKQQKRTPGKVMVKMINNPKRSFNTKVDQHETDGVKLNQKMPDINVENKADKQNGSGEKATTKATVLNSDSLFKVRRVSSEGSEMKKLAPPMSGFKVGALGQNVEIYRIPGQKPKPLISKPVVLENKSPTTSKTKDFPLQRTQIQEKTAKIEESNGHVVQASKTDNSPLCHIEIFKVQNHSDKKLCLSALEGTEVSLRSVAEVPSTKLVSLANKLEQNLEPVVKSSTKMLDKSVSGTATVKEKLEKNLDDMEDTKMDVQDGESSTSDEGKSEQNLLVKSADDEAPSVEPSDPKMHLQNSDDNAMQPEHKSDARAMHEENDIDTSTEKVEKNLEPEVFNNAKIHDDSPVTTGELEQTSQSVLTDDQKGLTQNSNTTSPISEKPAKAFPRPCKSISLPSQTSTTAIAKKVEETVEHLEPKEHVDVTQNKTEDESEKNMEVQEQEECLDMAKTVEEENVSDITQNIVEELLNGATMFADTDSVEPEVPLSLGEPERKTNEAEQLSDILGSTHETELPQDISKLIEQTEQAVDAEKVEDKKEDKPDDTTNEKQSEAEEVGTVKETSEEHSQDASGEGAVVPTDCDERSADCKRGLDRTEDERQCHICAKSFPASALQRHIASHWCEKDLLCEKCGISFFFPADLERHVISHGPQELAGNKEDSVPMKQHQPPPKVSRQRTFTCGACGLDFTNWFQLRDHKLVHKKGKRHRCGSCSKHFRTKYLLQNHMWVHTMLKKPNCELCGKTFSLPWYVDRHITEEHS